MLSLFVILATLHNKMSSTHDWHKGMYARSGLLFGIIFNMRSRGDSIYTVELKKSAALGEYVLFVIKFFAIHQNMGPAQWGTTCWQKLKSQSYPT
jgi:hypothetical protein